MTTMERTTAMRTRFSMDYPRGWLLDRIIPPRVEGVTAGKPGNGHSDALDQAIALQGLAGIFGAGWIIAAGCPFQGGEVQLIDTQTPVKKPDNGRVTSGGQ